MCHQSEIEKKKYRNWVKGGLAYKYLKQGLEDFADDVVNKEHKRIIAAINNTAGINCNHCYLRTLQPLHTCKRDHTGKKTCPYGLFNCNCLHGKKQRCPANICDGIMEEILKSHGSTPPQPYWQNTGIQKWCSEPWEVAKCYINAPGYSDKTNAADIDISGLLHVFINNINLHSHIACSMMGSSNIFTKVRGRRNSIFHSPSMEMEDKELTECVEDIIAILEDTKELKTRKDAQEAVKNLRKLKTEDLIITTHNEIEVCREALSTVTRMTKGLERLIQDAKEDINKKQADASNVMDDEIQTALKGALDMLSNNDEIKKLEQAMKLIGAKVDRLHSDYEQRLSQIKDEITALKEKGNQNKTTERLEYLENKQKLQDELVKYYKKYYVNTSLTPLKQQQDSTNVKDIYVPPEIEVIEEEKDMDRKGKEIARNSANEEKVKTLYSRVQLDKGQYREKESQPEKKKVKGYHDIFQAKNQRHKKIYILGDVGTGKSTFCKMMIENWCNAVNNKTDESILNENGHDAKKTVSSDTNIAQECEKDVRYIEKYDLLFFIPLQYMSTFKSDATVDMIKELTKDLTLNTELIDRIFQEDSGHCLIIADSLDEWLPPKDTIRKPHVSYGIPNGDRAKDATVITLSRPSAIGILNLKNSELDIKLQLLGISGESLGSFIERYISKTPESNKTYDEFKEIMKTKKIEYVEKTPLFLQQLLWLYCNGIDIGKSLCETYCQILNTMCGWSDHRKEKRDKDFSLTGPIEDYKNLNLTKSLNRFPRIKENISVLYRLGNIAYKTCSSDKVQATFGLSNLKKHLMIKDDIEKVTDLGILNKSKCFGQMLEDTQFSFIHISYIEFFAALYLAIYPIMEQTAPVTVLDLLFCRCKSISGVVQLSNVIRMLCGLSPDLIGDLAKRISSIVNVDGQILQHREDQKYNMELIQIQKLMINCINECDTDSTTIISLSDLYISDKEPIPPLDRIKPENVISLFIHLNKTKFIKYIAKFVTQCKRLQYVNFISPAKQIPESVQFSFTRNVSLKQLRIFGLEQFDKILSMSNHLQAITLKYCNNVSISYLNTEQLKRVYIEECNGIDLSCFLTASKLTDFCLVYCWEYIDMTPLWSILQQALFLRHLTLESLRHDEGSSDDYIYIDLSRHHHLQKLKLNDCLLLVITRLNTEQFEHVYISKQDIYDYEYDEYSPVIELANSSARKLSKLYLENVNVNIATLVSLLRNAPLQNLTMIRVSDSQQAVDGRLSDFYDDMPNDVKGHTTDEPDDESVVESHVRDVFDNQSVVEGHISGVSNKQYDDKGHSKCVSDDHTVVSSHLTGVSNQPDCECYLRDVSGNRSVVEGHMRSLSDVQNLVEGLVHVLDLSMQNELTDITIVSCDQIKISNINTEKLEKVHIAYSNDNHHFDARIPVLAFNISSDTSRLIELYLQGVTANVASLLLLIKYAPLRQLTLVDVSDDQSAVQGHIHVIDLSKQNQLRKLYIKQCGKIKISNINSEQLVDIHLANTTITVLESNIPSNASNLSYINLKDLTCDKKTLLLLLQHSNLKKLTLTRVNVDQPLVHGRLPEIYVDFSEMNQLQLIKLSSCKNIKIVGLNTKQLGKVHIIDCPRILNFGLLSEADRLFELCDEHDTCDITLKPSVSHQEKCPTKVVKRFNDDQCLHVTILNRLCQCSDISVLKFCPLSNTSKCIALHLTDITCNISSLASFLQSTTLRELDLTRVSGDQSVAEGNLLEIDLDLSKQNQLQILKLSCCKNIFISQLNTEKLEKMYIEDCPYIIDFYQLFNARKLIELNLTTFTCDGMSLSSVLQQIPFKMLSLENVHFDNEIHNDSDLYRQNHLENSKLVKCHVTVVKKKSNNDQDVQVYFDDCHTYEQPKLNFIFSSNVRKLTELHIRDLTCDKLSIAFLLKHAILRQLDLKFLTAKQSTVESDMNILHGDLSTQNKLQILNLSYCKYMTFSNLNTEMLEHVYIESCPGILDFSLLLNASRLTELHLKDISSTTSSSVLFIQKTTSKQPTLTFVSGDQYNIEGHVIGVSGEQPYIEGHVRGKSHEQPMVKDHMRSVLDDQSDVDNHLEGVSDDQTDVDGLMRGVSDDQYDVNGLIGGVSDDQYDVDGLMRGVTDDQTDVDGLMRGVSDDQYDVDSLIRGVSDDQYDVDSFMKGVSEDQYDVDGLIRGGVSDDQTDADGLMRGVSDDQPDVDGLLRGVSDDQPDADDLMRGVSDDQPHADGLIRGVSDDQTDADGLMRGVSDDQYDVDGLMRDVSDDQTDADGLMKGVSDDQPDADSLMRDVSNEQPEAESRMFVIDLSMQNQLRILKLMNCDQIRISNINIEHIEQIFIDYDENYIYSYSKISETYFKTSSNKSNLNELHLNCLTANIKSLAYFLQQATLRNLTLISVSGFAVKSDMPVIHMDLSQQDQLQILKISDCRNMTISKINTENLTEVHVEHCPGILNFDLLSNAESLAKIYVEFYTDNVISLLSELQQSPFQQLTSYTSKVHCYQGKVSADLFAQSHLQNPNHVKCCVEIVKRCLDDMYEGRLCCSNTPVLYLELSALSNTSNQISVRLFDLTCDISSLVSSIQQNTLRHMTLTRVSGDQSAVEGNMHVIHVDLSKQNQLWFLKLSDCKNIKISALNTEMLQYVHIESCPGILDFNILSNARRLYNFHLENLRSTTSSPVLLVQNTTSKQLTLTRLSHDGCSIEAPVIGVSDKQADVEGSERGKSDYQPDGEDNIRSVSDDQSHSDRHFEGISDDQFHGEGHVSGKSEDHLDGEDNIKVASDDQTHVNCHLRDVSVDHSGFEVHMSDAFDDKSGVECHIRGVSADQPGFGVQMRDISNIASLASIIQQAPLRTLTLISVSGVAGGSDMPVKQVDLSKQNKLKTLKLSDCKIITISNINTESLREVHIEHCPGILDFDLLSNAEKLIKLYVEFYTCDVIKIPSVLQQAPFRQLTSYSSKVQCDQQIQQNTDLSRHSQSQNPKPVRCCVKVVKKCQNDYIAEFFEYESRFKVQVLDLEVIISTKASNQIKLHLVDLTCDISSLVSSLQQNTLIQLTLTRVSGDQFGVESDVGVIHVDLSKQNQLKILKLSHCKNIKISDINTEQLEKVHIEPCHAIFDFGRLLNARKLTKLSLKGGLNNDKFQYNKQINDVVHSLHQLRTLTLENVDIDESALTVTTAMKSLETIRLYDNTNMSLNTWCTFIDSLLNLHQSVVVDTNEEKQEEKRNYVRRNPKFKVSWDYISFQFESRVYS